MPTTTTEQHIGWGKPRIFVKDLEVETPAFIEVPTPAEDTTTLTVTKGDKVEAKLEGGENEDVKYNKNNYSLSYAIRLASGKDMPIDHDEGTVAHKYRVVLQPENPASPGFCIDRSGVSVEEAYTAAEGGRWTYTHDALKASTGEKIKWGTITVTTATGGAITIKGQGMDFGDTEVTL